MTYIYTGLIKIFNNLSTKTVWAKCLYTQNSAEVIINCNNLSYCLIKGAVVAVIYIYIYIIQKLSLYNGAKHQRGTNVCV
jgi:hypothetical protein